MVDLAKFKNIFISEVEDQLEKLNEYLLKIEKIVDDKNSRKVLIEDLNELMRASHTIKGSSASMGYVKMAFLAHVMEDVFDAARNNKLTLNLKIINAIYPAIDNLEKSLNSIKTNSIELDFDHFSDKLKNFAGVNTMGVGKSIKNEIDDSINDEIKPKPALKNEEDNNAPNINDTPITKVDHIKVPVKRLDILLDLVEELLIDKMRLEEISLKHIEIKEISNHISLLVSGIQYEIMQARMVPVEQIFARFPRMVRDLAIKENKTIDFIVNVGDIELDRTIVDKLGEPLIHLLRNAVDHGIKKSGVIKLEAIRKSESVVFIVENDGGGINFDEVRETAVRKGFASQAEIANYTEEQLTDLLFDPNFSTNTVVTEVSGRGVGLSVVKKFVETFSGKVLVENSSSGVRFLLELPQTLAIIEALLVSAAENIFAIPFTNIVRSVSVPEGDIKKMGDHDMAMIDGINVPLVDLGKLFQMQNIDENINVKDGQKLNKNTIAVLIKNENELAGIIVNRLIGEQEVIVKPFTSILHSIKGFSGSTILGDGKVVLILDVLGLLKNINK